MISSNPPARPLRRYRRCSPRPGGRTGSSSRGRRCPPRRSRRCAGPRAPDARARGPGPRRRRRGRSGRARVRGRASRRLSRSRSPVAAPIFRASAGAPSAETDLAVLVLDVQLDRRQPVSLEVDVLLELPRERGERHRSRGRLEPRRAAASGPTPIRESLLESSTARGRGRLGIGTEKLGAETDRRGRHQQDADRRRRADGASCAVPLPADRRKRSFGSIGAEEHRHRRVTLPQSPPAETPSARS